MERFVLKYPNCKFVGLDQNSGGYPYETDDPEVWYDLEKAKYYKKMFKDLNFEIYKLCFYTERAKEYKHGLTIGRLQPFHYGHWSLFTEMLDCCEKVTFVLGSTQENRTIKNPFTEEERLYMINNIMAKEIKEGKFNVICLPDINNLPKWSEYVLNSVKEPVDILFAGTEEDTYPFKNYPVKSYEDLEISIFPRYINGEGFKTGTEIRNLIYKNNPLWENEVPIENVDYIKNILKKEDFIKLENL